MSLTLVKFSPIILAKVFDNIAKQKNICKDFPNLMFSLINQKCFFFFFFFPCKKVEFWVERRQKWRKIKVRSEGSEIWFCSQSLFSLLGTWPNGGLLSYLGNLFPRKLKIGIIIPRKLGFHFSLLVFFIFYFYCLDSWHSYEFLFLSVCNSKVNKVQKFNEHRMPYGKIFVTTFHETIFEIYF